MQYAGSINPSQFIPGNEKRQQSGVKELARHRADRKEELENFNHSPEILQKLQERIAVLEKTLHADLPSKQLPQEPTVENTDYLVNRRIIDYPNEQFVVRPQSNEPENEAMDDLPQNPNHSSPPRIAFPLLSQNAAIRDFLARHRISDHPNEQFVVRPESNEPEYKVMKASPPLYSSAPRNAYPPSSQEAAVRDFLTRHRISDQPNEQFVVRPESNRPEHEAMEASPSPPRIASPQLNQEAAIRDYLAIRRIIDHSNKQFVVRPKLNQPEHEVMEASPPIYTSPQRIASPQLSQEAAIRDYLAIRRIIDHPNEQFVARPQPNQPEHEVMEASPRNPIYSSPPRIAYPPLSQLAATNEVQRKLLELLFPQEEFQEVRHHFMNLLFPHPSTIRSPE